MGENKLPFSTLIVDDEPHACLGTEISLRSNGIDKVIKCTDSSEVMPLIKQKPEIGIVLLDLIMPGLNGEQLLEQIKKDFPHIIVIIVTGMNEIEKAVDCMRKGAYDYILKPVDENRLITTVLRAADMYGLIQENEIMRQRLMEKTNQFHEAFAKIITQNSKMFNLFRYCEAVASTSHPILITGETGVGKELFAQALHHKSERKGEFVAVNIAGLDANMFSDTLFGHAKGAFTGADRQREGLVEKATNGTLFLDEIGDLSEESQVKLLRLLQESEYSPLGLDIVKKSNARIIVATHKDLMTDVEKGQFRKDLYYRLYTHHIHIPPLRERLDDIPILIDYFFESISEELGKNKPTFPNELNTLLKNYHFPGNIRELRAMIFDAISGHKSMILSMHSFRNHIKNKQLHPKSKIQQKHEEQIDSVIFPDKLPTLKEVSDALVLEAMKRANHNQSIAAGFLGISQQALSLRLKKMNC